MNIYTSEKVSKNSWQRLNEFMFEWDLEVNRIKRVPILSMEGNGLNAGDIIFRFPENWYQKYDTFIIEDLRVLVIVMNRPQRIADNCFIVIGKIVDDSYDSFIPQDFIDNCAGRLTRFVTNYMPKVTWAAYGDIRKKYLSNFWKP